MDLASHDGSHVLSSQDVCLARPFHGASQHTSTGSGSKDSFRHLPAIGHEKPEELFEYCGKFTIGDDWAFCL